MKYCIFLNAATFLKLFSHPQRTIVLFIVLVNSHLHWIDTRLTTGLAWLINGAFTLLHQGTHKSFYEILEFLVNFKMTFLPFTKNVSTIIKVTFSKNNS